MRRVFEGTVPKSLDHPQENEDKYFYSEEAQRMALCDGASISYDSKSWAEIVAKRFVENPDIGEDWLSSTVNLFKESHDESSMSWSQQGAYERGSFSTLLGIELLPDKNAVRITAIGDSAVILVDDDGLKCAWPFEKDEDLVRFNDPPTLLSTNIHQNTFFRDAAMDKFSTVLQFGKLKSPRLFCMTDEIARWALREGIYGGCRFGDLLALKTKEQFEDLIHDERAARTMLFDDSTLVILSLDEEGSDVIPDL